VTPTSWGLTLEPSKQESYDTKSLLLMAGSTPGNRHGMVIARLVDAKGDKLGGDYLGWESEAQRLDNLKPSAFKNNPIVEVLAIQIDEFEEIVEHKVTGVKHAPTQNLQCAVSSSSSSSRGVSDISRP